MDLYLKSFLLGKDGESDGRQDALAYNIDARLFAIADGVSNSYHPEIVAQALCEIFVHEDSAILNSWEDYSKEHLLPAIKDIWERKIKEHLDSLTSRLLRHELFNFETWKLGASTFCGIYIDETENLLRYAIIGDSTLFITDTDGSVQEINSSPKVISENGEELTDYSNSTSAVLSNDTISGEWLVGSISLEKVATISIMTDGMAKWFQKELVDGKNPYSTLWGITDSRGFKELADAARLKGDMDDDLAVILISITSVEPSTPKEPIADRTDALKDKKISSEKEQCNEAKVASMDFTEPPFNTPSETEEPLDDKIAESEKGTQSEENEHPKDKQANPKEHKNSFFEKIKATIKIWRNNHTD